MVGLGSDDDWILYPMILDDTKLKEQLFIQLWNRRADQVDWNVPMSKGEYKKKRCTPSTFGRNLGRYS